MVTEDSLREFDDKIAVIGDPGRPEGWIKVRAGLLQYSDGNRAPYIQVYVVRQSSESPSGYEVGDLFDTEELDSTISDFRHNRLDWYEEILELTWLAGLESEEIRKRLSW